MVGRQFGRFEVHERSGQGMLDSLVLADRSPKNHPFPGIPDGLLEGRVSQAKCFSG